MGQRNYKTQPRDAKGRFLPFPKEQPKAKQFPARSGTERPKSWIQPRDAKGRFLPFQEPRPEPVKVQRSERPKSWAQPRDAKGRFLPFSTEARREQAVSFSRRVAYGTYEVENNPSIVRDRGGRYAVVAKVTYKSGNRTEVSYHTVIQHSKQIDDKTRQLLFDRVLQMYNGRGVKVESVQTIDRLAPTEKRLPRYAVYSH